VAIRASIAEALNLVLHIERRQGRRFVAEVLRIKRYLPPEDRYEFEPLFRS
jgi:pilus assembly protein CpaF